MAGAPDAVVIARLRDRWDRWRRRRFGRFYIEDPRPIAEAAPYTYFLPSENELLALMPGDLAKLNFAGTPGGLTYGGERMWVTITQAEGDRLSGRLENEPCELHQLRIGDVVKFRRHEVIDCIWSEGRAQTPPSAPPRREYWERCLVDGCVLDDGVPVSYLFREEPDMTRPDDRFADSGWRIRGDNRGVSEADMDDRAIDYIALGKVLNADDRWLHLIDAPAGSAFLYDEAIGAFVPLQCEGDEGAA